MRALSKKQGHVFWSGEMRRTREVYPQISAAEREARLNPYRAIIDAYVLRFSDKPIRYPASIASYGTERRWATYFIEAYVLNHGQLPDRELQIDVLVGGTGYSGAGHDFSDLKLSAAGF